MSSTAVSSPGPWHANPPRKTRTVAQRKVYGKRKVDAPRAVFDQRSPPKLLDKKTESSVQEALDSIQTQLAEIKIDETPTTRRWKEIADEPINPQDDETQEIEPADPQPTDAQNRKDLTIEEKIFDEPTAVEAETFTPPPPTSTPKASKRFERMVAVRISPRILTAMKTQKQWKDLECPPDSNRTRKAKPMARLSWGCVSNGKANAYVRPILDEAISPVAAQSIHKFNSWAARAGNMLEVVKMAEGSYGEVYKLRLREEVCKREMSKSKLARLKAYGDGVFKIVPLRAKSGPGSKKFTKIDEIVSEVKMLKYLDPIPGFARFREIHVVQGRFPESFQKAWDHYKETKDDCLNPDPSSSKAYPDTQLWAIVEMDDAGCELEKFAWSSTFQIYDIFWGVAMALARAEEYAMFEHRDLHLGNVCIRTTRPDGRMEPPTDSEIMRQPTSSGFGLSTLETTIIDYSLSRAELHLSEESPEAIEIASSDLDKKQIFDAIGRDEDEILLRNTYRHMRAQLYNGSPLEVEKTRNISGIWAEYAPRTNLVWLLFLLKSLLKNKKPELSAVKSRQPLEPRSPNKESKQTTMQEKGKAPHRLQTEMVLQSKVGELRNDLEERLNTVIELLDLEHGHEDMCCAADLVAFAIDSQWLDEQDFF
ncbi:hypothetical protein FE257_005472 [Aspergillus nanangensis]|uniref:non-specific serine/threonine protein kinase n=1 Tax=Aspergillus nanangensis TaxID=2582783 RepID=A0AAD4CQL8_ASPNN|nr:hypothetical protein FE257_005472 [Aspergillus nanangensis]